MDTLDFDRVLDAVAECAHGLLAYALPARLNAYAALDVLTRKLEERQNDDFRRVSVCENFWRIRAHADAMMGFLRGTNLSAEAHLDQMLEAIAELRAAAGRGASRAVVCQDEPARLCLAS